MKAIKRYLLPPVASALVAQVYKSNLPISLFISRKNDIGMIPIIAIYEDSVMFDKIMDKIEQKQKTNE